MLHPQPNPALVRKTTKQEQKQKEHDINTHLADE
jgi:hypothetical protein